MRSEVCKYSISLIRLVLLLVVFGFCSVSQAKVLSEDTTWQGEVLLDEDVLVPSGITLTVAPGTVVKVKLAESTKIDPEYISHMTELTIRGSLRVMGELDRPVAFSLASGDNSSEFWGGIIVDHGNVFMQHCRIEGAESGLYILAGIIKASSLEITNNRYGVVAQGNKSFLQISDSNIHHNSYGLLNFAEADIKQQQTVVVDNEKKDYWQGAAVSAEIPPETYTLPDRPLTLSYDSETIMGNMIWQGRIRIDGQVKLAEEARLVIMPGTVVEFGRRDSNGDGIGENGLLVQGALIAKGTEKQPIIFRSAENSPQMGDWDSVNILGSDNSRNLIEFCQIENAYRGLHLHFSNVAVTNTIFRNNFRGMQFQESLLDLRDNQFYHNKSAVQARDSELVFRNNLLVDNVNGANFLRMNIEVRGNIFANNLRDGLRIREGAATVEQNIVTGNRYGLLVADAVFGKFSNNLLAGNLESGMALKNTDHLETKGNAILSNGINGIVLNEARGEIRDSFIADNGERGIGVLSFHGKITNNTIVDNGLYAIGLDGKNDVEATGNWWGDTDLSKEIFDSNDDLGLGTVNLSAAMGAPIAFVWPVSQIPVDLAWSAAITIQKKVTVMSGATLTVKPGTVVSFADNVGMDVLGKIEARGEAAKRISFTSIARKGPEDWSEISLDRAMGSIFINSDFEYATWGLHSHYTDLRIMRCRFRYNDGGLRFRSGPMDIKNSLFTENRIALRAFRANGNISYNDITANEIGVFIREEGQNMQVTHNNLANNERYNMRLGDFNDQDVDARNNWWGGVPVIDTIFDGNRESYIGKVLYEPELDKPVKLDW